MHTQPDLADTINRAYRQYYGGDYEAAWDSATRGLKQFAGNFDLLYVSGLAQARRGDDGAAEALIENARDAYPGIKKFDSRADFLERYAAPSRAELWEFRLEEFQKHRLVKNFILSYPKCGRTWVRYVLGSYAVQNDPAITSGERLEVAQLTAKDEAFPVTEFSHEDHPHARPPAEISSDKSIYAGKKVVFLIRDPRDVLVSFYFQYTRRGRIWEFGQEKFDGTMTEFIQQPDGGLASLVTYFNIWAAHRGEADGYMLLRYEELQDDPIREFSRLIGFLDWPDFGEDEVRRAVTAGRFEEMHNLESSGDLESIRLAAPASGDPEAFKTRRGIVGGYVDYLDQSDIDYIDAYLDEHLDDTYSYYKR